MNSVQLIGRLTKDPDVRYNNNGFCIVTFTLAIDRPKGKGEKDTDFPRVRVLGRQAENCETFLHKGSQVGVTGSIQTGSYINRDGEKVYTTEVLAGRVEFLSNYGTQQHWETADTATEPIVQNRKDPEPRQESFVDDDFDIPY